MALRLTGSCSFVRFFCCVQIMIVFEYMDLKSIKDILQRFAAPKSDIMPLCLQECAPCIDPG